MNNILQAFAAGQSVTEFADRVASKWRRLTEPSPPRLRANESPEDILRDIIGMPTISGNTEAIHHALDYIERFLKNRGMYVTRHTWNGVESLVATTRPTKTPTVFLAGHIDVVPAPAELFDLQERDGKYYGRGVLDMKGAIAAYLSVIKELPGDLAEYDFGVMIMSDEEVGGFDGAQNLAREGYLSKVMVLPDGGDSDFGIEKFAKGIWHMTVEATGKNAHGSRPWEGENAIDKLTATLADIRALFPRLQTPNTSTVNIGIIQGGKAINQIPASASASLDMRFASAKDQAHIHAAVSSLLKRNNIRLITEVRADAMITDPENPFIKAYAECTASVTKRPVRWVTSNAGNDGRFFTAKGVACAVAYPTGGNHHGHEEWISKQAYADLQRLLSSYLRRVALVPADTHVTPSSPSTPLAHR